MMDNAEITAVSDLNIFSLILIALISQFYKKINDKKKSGKNRLFDMTLAKKYYIKSAAFSAVTKTVPVSILSGMLSPLASFNAFSTPIYPIL